MWRIERTQAINMKFVAIITVLDCRSKHDCIVFSHYLQHSTQYAVPFIRRPCAHAGVCECHPGSGDFKHQRQMPKDDELVRTQLLPCSLLETCDDADTFDKALPRRLQVTFRPLSAPTTLVPTRPRHSPSSRRITNMTAATGKSI